MPNEAPEEGPVDIEEKDKGKLIFPNALIGRKRNKVVPIMEVPSSDSERSSIRPTVPVTHLNSARSSDPDSYGFIPR